MNNNDYVSRQLLNVVTGVALVALSFTATPIAMTLIPFQMFATYWMWRGVRDEIQDGNKQ